MKRLFFICIVVLATVASCFAQMPKVAQIKPFDWYADVNMSASWRSNCGNYSLDGTWYWRTSNYFNLGAGLSASMVKYRHATLYGGSYDPYEWEPYISPHISVKGVLPVSDGFSFFAAADLGAYFFFFHYNGNSLYPNAYFDRSHFYVMPKLGIRFKISEKGTAFYVAGTYESIPFFYRDASRDFVGLCIGVNL